MIREGTRVIASIRAASGRVHRRLEGTVIASDPDRYEIEYRGRPYPARMDGLVWVPREDVREA